MNKNLTRLENESQDQYFYRICSMKESLGFTWPQMAEVFNKEFGDNIGDTAYRKRWNSFQRIMDANADKFVSDDSYLAEVQAATQRMKMERQKLSATKIEIDRTLRQKSRSELFYENVSDAIEKLPMPSVTYGKDVYLVNDSKEYVLCLADIQAGAKFELPVNSYSLSECENRFNRLLDMSVDFINDNHINKITVVTLGDDIQGILRLTDLKLNETSVVEATVTVARLIASFLNQLSAYCYVEYYHSPTSNHSQMRQIGSKANELAAEDMEYVIGHYIQDILTDNHRVSVHLNDGYDYIEIPVFNFNVLAMHGHTIKNVETALKDLSVVHRKLIDYLIIGHFHNGKVIPGNEHEHHDTEVLICPSFQGTDPYAYHKLGKSSKAACKLFVFDKTYGCVGTHKFILN